MKITYYLEVVSSWCHWCEPVWAQLKQKYAGQVDFTWKIALMRPEDYPVSKEQCDWFYRRSGSVMRSPYMLSSGWLEKERAGDYTAPNYVAEAARELGVTDDRVRLALAQAAVREGRKVGDLATSVEIAAKAASLDPAKLRARAESADLAEKVKGSTAEFLSYQISQRPAFVLEDSIGDKAVFSGLVRLDPLVATIEAMMADTAAYASHKAHFGTPPQA